MAPEGINALGVPFSLFLRRSTSMRVFYIRELSFLMLGTGVEEFLEGYQICLVLFCCQIVSPIHDGVAKFPINSHHNSYLHANCRMCTFLNICIKLLNFSN